MQLTRFNLVRAIHLNTFSIKVLFLIVFLFQINVYACDVDTYCSWSTSNVTSDGLTTHFCQGDFFKNKDTIVTHTLNYSAGDNGYIEGESFQEVKAGSDGSPVEANPADGYRFIQWSDGLKDNPRIDRSVHENIDVVARFGPGIIGRESLCPKQWATFSIHENVAGAYKNIFWTVELGQTSTRIRGPSDQKDVLIEVGHKTGTFKLEVCLSNNINVVSCEGLNVQISGSPPDTAWVQQKGRHILLVNHTVEPRFDAFQWGKINKSTYETLLPEEATGPYHYFEEPVDTSMFYYWVDARIDDNSCSSRTFFNHPDENDSDFSRLVSKDFVNIYPIPAQDVLTLEMFNSDIEVEGVRLINSFGNILSNSPDSQINFTNKINLDVRDYPPGVYFIVFYTKCGSTFSEKILFK